MKYLKQREIILRTLQQNAIHPTADKLYELVKKKLPDISLATVYRNLNQMAELGIIKKSVVFMNLRILITKHINIIILLAKNAIRYMISPMTLYRILKTQFLLKPE